MVEFQVYERPPCHPVCIGVGANGNEHETSMPPEEKSIIGGDEAGAWECRKPPRPPRTKQHLGAPASNDARNENLL